MSKVLKYGCYALMLLFMNGLYAQQNTLPLHTFYKDKFVENSGKRSIETFFPANENQLDLHHLIRDSSIQYYEFTDWLFKKNWITISKKEGSLTISPIGDFTYGRDLSDSSGGSLFRNTRGLYAEGELLKKIGFNFAIVENQARFMKYESDYFDSRGELYDFGEVYSRQNAVIPGGARTKPFKVGAYDYAYSMGSVSYQMNSRLRLEVGNNQHFIGSGYRSLLLSDNSLSAMGLKAQWKINSKWSYQVLIRKQNNLYRKPATKAVESPYEAKFFGLTYLTYKPLENLSISLFTAGNQLRGDSLIKHSLQWQMVVPVPLIQNDVLFGNSNLFNGISGLNVDFALENIRLYGQLAVDKFDKKYLLGGQFGAHFFKILKVKDLNAQVEMNVVPQHFYAAQNDKLSYSNGNLPSAHPKGNNFGEVLARLNYEYKRIFISSKSVYYAGMKGSDSLETAAFSIFSINESPHNIKTNTFLQEFEVGYRINRKYNCMISAGWKGRFSRTGATSFDQSMVFIGLKTGIFNQYLDF